MRPDRERSATKLWLKYQKRAGQREALEFLLEKLEQCYLALANTPQRVAGAMARLQVRAGLDPHILSVDDLVKDVMHGDHGVRHMSLENRAICATAAIRGWVEAGRG